MFTTLVLMVEQLVTYIFLIPRMKMHIENILKKEMICYFSLFVAILFVYVKKKSEKRNLK